jgi:hypothetical protein
LHIADDNNKIKENVSKESTGNLALDSGAYNKKKKKE